MSLPTITPPFTTLGKKIESMIRKALFEYQLLERVPHLALALSGGKDSLTLLYFLAALRGNGAPNFKLSALHISGAYSCGSSILAPSLKKICEKLDVDFYERDQNSENQKKGCYPCSRERRRLLFHLAKELNVSTIAFGHHRDDSIQTLLMNLLHKAEFASNLPKIHMSHYGITIIRPLIFVSEDEITRFAQDQGYLRVLCRCPIGQNSMRKKTDQLIRFIEKTYPNARANLALASRVYGSDKANRV